MKTEKDWHAAAEKAASKAAETAASLKAKVADDPVVTMHGRLVYAWLGAEFEAAKMGYVASVLKHDSSGERAAQLRETMLYEMSKCLQEAARACVIDAWKHHAQAEACDRVAGWIGSQI